MKKLFLLALVAIATLSSCRQDDETTKTEEYPQLKKTNEALFSRPGDTIIPDPGTGIGPVVTIPPR